MSEKLEIKCPKCGSKNVYYWCEKIRLDKHHIDEDGQPYEKPYEKTISDYDTQGYGCNDCGHEGYWADDTMFDFEKEVD